MDKEIEQLTKKAQKYQKNILTIKQEIGKAIVGQEDIIDKVLLCLLANGHVLLEGVPGLAKTMLIKTLSQTLSGEFNRIQFTPDLLPSDIIGTKIYNQKSGDFVTKKGPIFANYILADEINRAPPKVQSALLEAMQEKQVTISGDTFTLEKPFLVLATQNPIESEGTYNLPEAQVDRFMFKVLINYPTKEEEKKIMQLMTTNATQQIKKQMTPEQIIELQQFTREIYVDDTILDYVTHIIDATRNPKEYGIDETLIDYGVSPRASIWMILGAKAHALTQARGFVIPEDIIAVAKETLRHRLVLSYEAQAEDVSPDDIIQQILEIVKIP